jgi:dienelactone hydrolase
LTGSSPHVIVLPGGGYAEHAAHEGEPIARWLKGLGVAASVFRYPLMVRHPAPLNALRAEIRRLRDGGSTRIGVIGFSAGGDLAGLAALADDADADEAVDFAVLGYAITSMETETYRPSRLILLGEDATPELRRATSLDALVTRLLATVLSLAHRRRRVRAARAHIPASCLARRPRCSTCRPCLRPRPTWTRLGKRRG